MGITIEVRSEQADSSERTLDGIHRDGNPIILKACLLVNRRPVVVWATQRQTNQGQNIWQGDYKLPGVDGIGNDKRNENSGS